jgi:hypothetical protein
VSAAAVWLACADDDYGLYFNPRGEVVIRQEGNTILTKITGFTSKSKI